MSSDAERGDTERRGTGLPEPAIRTPDQRLRVFVSSTLQELAAERAAVRRAIDRLRLIPVMFEHGARPHAPRELYRAYLAQSHVFVGVYWQRYGWVAPTEPVSGLEDEYRLAGERPRLLYIKEPSPDREPRLQELLADIKSDDRSSYRRFRTAEELERVVTDDLAVLLSERFELATAGPTRIASAPVPEPLTRTIGREAIVAELVGRLGGGARLVTLTGPGGIGKTRVALEAARALAEEASMQVGFVDLAAVRDPQRVMPTIADRLDIRLEGTRSAAETIAAAFGRRHQVVVLDNVEQVIAWAPELAWLLERCPGLHILTTSRERLRLRGEQMIAVPPLDVPARGASLATIAESPAVQLFVWRATDVAGSFTLDADNAGDVAELCRRLDGVPLAIELAAARVRLLPPSALLARIGGRLELASGNVDLPSRQRTLRAAIDWSYGLLDDVEAALLARMSVFSGGATLDAIEQVCASPDTPDPLSVLGALVDKSLVTVSEVSDGSVPRCGMLETIHQYASERLNERGEENEFRRRHRDYYAGLARTAQPFLCGPGQREWATRFDDERANLRAAVTTGLEEGQLAAVVQLIYDTAVYYYIRDAFDEPIAWLLEVRREPSGLGPIERANVDAMVAVAGLVDDAGVVTSLQGAAELYGQHGLVFERAVAEHHLGLALWRTGRHDEAVAALERSSSAYGSMQHDWGVAIVDTSLGAILTAGGDPARGADRHRRALEHAARIDNRPLVAQALQGLSISLALDGRTGEARRRLIEATEVVEAERLATTASYCLETVAELLVQADEPERAIQLLESAEAIRCRLSAPAWTATEQVTAGIGTRARQRVSAGGDAADRDPDADPDADPFAVLRAELEHLDDAAVSSASDGA
jgi:predicted ATPase